MAKDGDDEKASGSTPSVFISYASPDDAIAETACEALEKAGVTCWIAPRDVTPGAFYGDEIVHAIDATKAVVLILSQNAATSPHVLREVERAASKRHAVISLRVDKAPLPAGLEYFLNTSQWLDASSGDTVRALPKLVSAVQLAIQAPTVSPTGVPAAPAPALAASAGSRRRMAIIVASVVSLALAGFAADRLWLSSHRTAATSATTPIGSAPAPVTAAPAIPEKSVAVLPFVDMSEKKDQEYFSDGLSEELIDMLAKVPELRVPARTSSFYFKGKQATLADIAKALGVTHVLEGSVRKSGSALRVTAQLIRVDSGYHIWSETYDRNQEDVFKIQDDIARAVVDKLRLTLLGGEVPRPGSAAVNSQVYSLYLEGRYLITSDTADDLARANECFQQALRLEPGYAPAWAGAAQVALRQVANGYAPVAATIARAEAAAKRAVQLDPNYADGFVTLGNSRAISSFDWSGAREAFEHALQLDPSNRNAQFSVAHLNILVVGSTDDTLQRFQQLLQGDPLNLLQRRYMARVLYYAGRLDEAEVNIRGVLQVNPSFPAAHYELGRILLARGQVPQAVREFESEKSSWSLLGLPLGYHAQGRTTDANAALQRMVDNSAGSEFQVAEAYAYFGNVDQAFAWLDRAVALRDPGIQWLRGDPLLRNLTGDARYAALLRRLNLPS